MSTSPHILIVDTNTGGAEAVREQLVPNGFRPVIDAVVSREAFEEALTEFQPDVVLSDHTVPGFGARSALEILRAKRPITPLILVTSTYDEDNATAALREGAVDIVLKQNLRRLPSAITRALAVRQPLQRLTPRQIEVFRLVAEGQRTKRIAASLGLSVKTVESHRTEVMKRLGLSNLAMLVLSAVRLGLVAPMTDQTAPSRTASAS
jgi:DNA-binding NarL/FixJ family response regulator